MQELSTWRRNMDNVMAGLAITLFTLNFLGLNYLLYTIGILLMLTAFRELQTVSRGFFICYLLSIVRAALHFCSLVLNATIYGESSLPVVINYISAALTTLLLVFLRSTIRQVQHSVNIESHTGSVSCLILFSLLFFTNVHLNGFLVLIVLLAAIIIVVRCLFGLVREVDEAGFTAEAAPVRISNGTLVKSFVVVLLAGIACGYLFANRYPMDWQPVSSTEHTEVQEIKAHLLELGFPDYVLDDLTAEDILACEGAQKVVVQYYAEYGKDAPAIAQKDDLHEFLSTGVSVHLPGNRQHWRIFHHFLWQIDPGFPGTEALQIWPACRSDMGWDLADPYTGRVLYNNGEAVFAAPYHSLGRDTYMHDSIFWGVSQQTDTFATFSMPRKGEHHRGYITYGVQEMRDGAIVDGWFNYIHQEARLQYPVQTAKQYRMNGGMFSRGPFRIIQDALQFYPAAETSSLQ